MTVNNSKEDCLDGDDLLDPLVPELRAPGYSSEMKETYARILGALSREFSVDRGVLAQMALEGATHLSTICSPPPPRPRILVLHGSDSGSMARLSRSLAAAMRLPSAIIPLTSTSEEGWQGRSLAVWIEQMAKAGHSVSWTRRGILAVLGLESVQMRQGTYTEKTGSGSTQDYRRGKSENLSALLSGLPIPTGDGEWDARQAMVLVTTHVDDLDPDPLALEDWGLLPSLAEILASACWIRIERAQGRLDERAIHEQLQGLIDQYEAFGFDLSIPDETIRWVAIHAEERGASEGIAASWIARQSRSRLIDLLRSGSRRKEVVIAPDDCIPPPPRKARWHD